MKASVESLWLSGQARVFVHFPPLSRVGRESYEKRPAWGSGPGERRKPVTVSVLISSFSLPFSLPYLFSPPFVEVLESAREATFCGQARCDYNI